MSFEHNQLAYEATAKLLRQVRDGQATWLNGVTQLTSSTGYWHGFAEWPRPDGMFEDRSTNTTLAIEFKPPGHQKAEYVRGLGQAVTYLRAFDYAVIVVPRLAVDKFPIANYLADTLKQSFSSTLPIGVFSYEQGASDLASLLDLRIRQGEPPQDRIGVERTVFWAYWRDLSNYDLLDIIVQMDSRQQDFDKAFQEFWDNKLSKGLAKTWEGTNRKPYSANSFNSQKANTYYSLRHVGLLDAIGQLTEAGYNLSRIGRVYGPSSVAFLQQLSRLVLLDGRHLELIFWVEQQQRKIDEANKLDSSSYYQELDDQLEVQGIIRSPSGKAKATFLRDEPKLWNKLGLLLPYDHRSYFYPKYGLAFNWRTIISAVGS
jgi:hypothetical protein